MHNTIGAFIAQAQAVQHQPRKAKQLCEDTLTMLYATYSDHMVHTKLTEYRNALRQVQLDTPFLQWLREPLDKIRGNRHRAAANVFARHGHQRPLLNVEAIVHQAETLLARSSYAAVGLGLALLTGRRPFEVHVQGVFEPAEDNHHLVFRGRAKTRDTVRMHTPLTIPVLCAPHACLSAVTTVREMKDFSWCFTRQNPSQAFQDVAGKTLRETCTRYFGALIPQCTPKDLRKVYAVIAYDWFAPPDMSLSRYISETLGHGIDDLGTAQSYQDFYLAQTTEDTFDTGS